mgnify:CR=1 FL=1
MLHLYHFDTNDGDWVFFLCLLFLSARQGQRGKNIRYQCEEALGTKELTKPLLVQLSADCCRKKLTQSNHYFQGKPEVLVQPEL